MRTTNIPTVVLAFAACVALLGLQGAIEPVVAQDLGGSSVTVEADPQLPIAGAAAAAIARFAQIEPESVALFYRPVGEIAYVEVAGVATSPRVYRAELPETMPAQGVDVYLSYTVDGQTITYPSNNPQLFPVRVPALSLQADSPQSLPPRQYRMVSVPFLLGQVEGLGVSLGSDDPGDVFGDDFGEDADPSQWRLLRLRQQFGGDLSPYLDYADNPLLFGPIANGAGYWLISARGGGFNIQGGLSAGAGFDGDDSFPLTVQVPLQAGWNQIGNPFLFPFRWSDVIAPSTVQPPVAFRGTYLVGQSVLKPWEGYFVYNSGEPDRLDFRVPPSTGGGGIVGDLPSELLLQAGDGAYLIEIKAVQGVNSPVDAVYLGLIGAGGATKSLDLNKPPAVDRSIRVSVPTAQGDLAAGFVARDSRSWALDVAETGGEAFDLSVAEFGDRPPGVVPVVLDLDNGARLPVISNRVYVPANRRAADVRHFRVELAPGGSAVSGVVIGRSFPNPFRHAVTIPYATPTGDPVRIEVFDLLGRSVRILADGPAESGAGDAVWDGVNESGKPAASGSYLIRVTTPNASAVSRVTLLR